RVRRQRQMCIRDRSLESIMTRRIFKSITLAVSLSLAGLISIAPVVSAQAEVPAVKKIAMVDMQRVLNETVAGKRARKELESSSKAKQGKLDKKRKKLEADAAKLEGMSGQTLMETQEKLQRESMELQSMLYALEQELGEQHNKMLEKMYRNAQSIVAAMAKSEGIDLVLVRDQMTVIYAKDAFDVTSSVIKKYDAKHK
ncbi:MAG: OmpH family outer membrane protein, partial [Nannocystaceae bacterium]|nr:OmpH family outer membrane protein [Nannocystaceae bacterium]